MFRTEALDASNGARICADGCLVAEVFAARTGIQDYLGAEVDPNNEHGLRDKAIVKVYRPPEEVFSRDSLASYAAAPITVDHPAEAVDASNWRKLGVGEIHGDIVPDGQRVRVPVIVRDGGAVDKALTTHKQLSMGYSTRLDFTPGQLADGTAYDVVQRDIRINHLALVRAARGGPELRITDERTTPGDLTMPKLITVDGLSVDVSNADVAATTISTLIAARDAAAAKVTGLEAQVATLSTDKATLTAEKATLEQQLKDAKPTSQQLRDAAKAYAQVCAKAKAMGVATTDAMDEHAIMKAVVAAKLGDAATDWNDTQIAASFATLTKDVKVGDADPTVTPIITVSNDGTNTQQLYDAMVSDLTGAWKPKQAA